MTQDQDLGRWKASGWRDWRGERSSFADEPAIAMPLPPRRGDLRDRIASARAAGATRKQIGAALGMTRQAAREFFTCDARTAIADDAGARQPSLGENEAIELAAEEVRAVRRCRGRS